MICFTVWWSLKVIIVLLHSLDKSRRLCVSVFTHYPVTVTKPTQQKQQIISGQCRVRIIPFGTNQGCRYSAELHKATVRRRYSLTHGSWTWGCGQGLRLTQELLSGHTALRDVLWKHLKQGRTMMMSSLCKLQSSMLHQISTNRKTKLHNSGKDGVWLGFFGSK